MLLDRQGNAVTGASPESLTDFDEAVRAFNIFRGDPVALADKAIAASPDFAMAHVLKAYLFATATEPEATQVARSILADLKRAFRDDRVTSHIAALDAMVEGNWTKAALQLDRHNMDFPLDMVGVQVGHLSDFYRANARNLRDRILRVLPHWSVETPGYSTLLGMLSFGLEESGDYARAEEMGRRAVDADPLDCWAHHAVAHVMEMQGRPQDGIGWMISREPVWAGDDNFIRGHNWWHRAVFHIDLGQLDQALGLYDAEIRGGASAVALDMVDASALLWRLELAGYDVGDRWLELSDAWLAHADGKLYPFNDWHAAMSHLGAGREARVDDIIAEYERDTGEASEAGRWRRELGLPLIEGFRAFKHGNFAKAAETLHPVRFIVNRFGGSHAQRDVIDLTLTEAAIRGGIGSVASALANERIGLKPHSPVNRAFVEKSVTLKQRLRAA
jgi:tetratricopeptide (TPR) repeat protein